MLLPSFLRAKSRPPRPGEAQAVATPSAARPSRDSIHARLLGAAEHDLGRTLDLFAAQPSPRGPLPREVVVVLGSPVQPDGSLGPSLARRIGRAVELAHARPNALLLVSGAAVKNHFVEAEAMATGLIAGGVDPQRVLLEPRARLTLENAAYTLRLLDSLPLLRGRTVELTVVTEPFHAVRAMRAFVAAGSLMTNPPLLRLAAAAPDDAAATSPPSAPGRAARAHLLDDAAWARIEACLGQKALVWLGW